MAKRKQWRRGTTTQHAAFTGAIGEVTVDTDKKTLVVHDGATAGGFALPRGLGGLDDLTVAGATVGDVIGFDGSGWVNGPLLVGSLYDVDLTAAPADGQTLVYHADARTWKPGGVSGGGASGEAKHTMVFNMASSTLALAPAGSLVSSLPGGWSVTTSNSNTVTVSHTAGKAPVFARFTGEDATGGRRVGSGNSNNYVGFSTASSLVVSIASAAAIGATAGGKVHVDVYF